MKWAVDWTEYYDAEGPKIIYTAGLPKRDVDPKELIGKRIINITLDDYGQMFFETED